MKIDIENTEEAVNMILVGLSYLIVHHAQAAACEQFAPHHTPDESDDYIAEHKGWVDQLRAIRRLVENLVTGLT